MAEPTTAATDVLLAVVCLVGVVALGRLAIQEAWKKPIWASVLLLLGLASTTGAVVHGVALSDTAALVLRRSLFPMLGVAVAMFVVGAIADWRGRDASRAARPWAIAAGVSVLALPMVFDSGFGLFVACEAIGMIVALIIYIRLWVDRRRGAGATAIGIALTLCAAVVQRSAVSATVFWTFDHNGLFHLVQVVALVVTAAGIRRSLVAK
jgi:hypothetical protein